LTACPTGALPTHGAIRSTNRNAAGGSALIAAHPTPLIHEMLINLAQAFSSNARKNRALLFRDSFTLDESTKILDLGSETGANINAILDGTRVRPEHVYIADIDREAVMEGHAAYGYVPVQIDQSGRVPFDDKFFDIVYCSSVIEHVTIPKAEVWATYSGRAFRERSLRRQHEFACEIRRLGKQYFVQTPHRHFPIESHTWLPFAGWMPRRLLVPTLRLTNQFWLKKTSPDWYLLTTKEFSNLFDEADIVLEKSFCCTKSIMAIKSLSNRPSPGSM
jgi:SAM-dependent methyltransferase